MSNRLVSQDVLLFFVPDVLLDVLSHYNLDVHLDVHLVFGSKR